MKITFSADEALVKQARARARAEKTTLTKAFRLWLEDYADTTDEPAPPSRKSRKKQPEENTFARCVTALKNLEKKLETKL